MKKKFITYLKLFTGTAIVLHIANQVIAASAELLDKLDRVNQKCRYKWRFGDIFFTKKGSGSPILLIHDLLPGSSGYEWNRIEDQLAKTHTVYTIDLLGCGRSAKPSMVYTNFLYVQMISDFIKNVIKEKTEIMTSGYAGSLAVMTAIYNKEVIHSITMVNPTDPSFLTKVPDSKESFIRKIFEFPIFGTLIYYIATCRENIDHDFTEKYYYNPYHIDRDIMDTYYEAAHKNGSSGKYLYASLVSKYTNINILPALCKLDLPVNIIMGSREVNQESIVKKYSTYLSDVSVHYVSKSKHFPHIENCEDFLAQITFLK